MCGSESVLVLCRGNDGKLSSWCLSRGSFYTFITLVRSGMDDTEHFQMTDTSIFTLSKIQKWGFEYWIVDAKRARKINFSSLLICEFCTLSESGQEDKQYFLLFWQFFCQTKQQKTKNLWSTWDCFCALWRKQGVGQECIFIQREREKKQHLAEEKHQIKL